MTKKPTVSQADYDRLLRRCETQAREIQKWKDEAIRQGNRVYNLDEQISALRIELGATRTAEQSRARRASQDAIIEASWKNGRG